MWKKNGISFKSFVVVLLLLALVFPAGQLPLPAVQAAAPSITVDAAKREGVYSPNVVGNMFEWGLNNMNGAWAEKAKNRNFEADSVNKLRFSLYDHFTGGALDRSKWTPKLLAGSTTGSYSLSGTNLTINGGADSRYGLLSRDIPNTVNQVTTIKAQLVSVTGTNALVSIYAGNGSTYTNFIEFGIEGGVLKVFADGQPTWTGGSAVAPANLKITVSHKKGGVRDFNFYYNNSLVYTLNGYANIGDIFRVYLYGYGASTTVWDAVSIYKNNLYAGFDGSALESHFTPALLEGSTNGTLGVSGGQLTITGTTGSRYGVLSERIRNSAVDYTEIEARIDSITGTNALMSIYGGTGSGDFSNFVEYGIEGGVLKVFTKSGVGNWSGAGVTLPGTLKVRVTPYYANGRNFRFYWNNVLQYTLNEVKDVPKADFRLFLYGYGSSTTKWNYINMNQEHFTDGFAPHFEGGGGLPVEWAQTVLAGTTWGTFSIADSLLTINGGSGGRYGIITEPVVDSDIKPYKISAYLKSYTGTNAMIHLTTGSGRNDFSQFIEYGIESGVLKVFTPSSSWTGPAAATPALLEIMVGPYLTGGRTITFLYNGEPVHEINNYTVLADNEYRVFLYGYGTSKTIWDYCTFYPIDNGWYEDGYDGRALYSLDDAASVSGRYSQKITVTEANGGRKGISQQDVDVTSGKQYQVSVWLKQSSLSSNVQIALGSSANDSPSYTAYASTTLSSIGSSFTKYTVTLTPNTTDKNAKLFIGTAGTGTLWLDQISIMPLDSSEVVYGGWRKDFVDRLIELNPVALRWPGGILADWYNWKDGIGSRDLRPPMYFAQWDAEWHYNDVGVDEFLQLSEAIGIKPTLNVNYGTGTAALAADWVEYVNGGSGTTWGAVRVNNGHSAPYAIKSWEIGNETWGWWSPGHTDAATFAADYLVFRDAMYAKDSTIKFIGEGGDGNSTDQSWNTTMIKNTATKLDELSIHYYSPQPLPKAYNDFDVYKASVAAPVSIKDRFKATQDVILDNSDEDIKIAVTEWNTMYFNTHQRREGTVEAALQVAGLLNLFLSDPGATDHNFYSMLNEFWDGGAIKLGSRGNYVTPSYHILKLYATKRGEMKVNSVVESATYNSPAIGNIPALSNVPYLDALATRSLDGQKLYISVVNRDSVNTYTTPITIQGVTGVNASANVYTLTASSYLAENTWKNPTNVQLASTTITNASTSFSYTLAKNSVTVFEFTITGLTAITGPVLAGKVTTATGTPISGATVTTNTGVQAVTDANGYYQVGIAAGTYTLTAVKSGYKNSTMNHVDVLSGAGTTSQPIEMVP
ncbi:MAG TPA: alpha-L-arabinofuranosidase C-terminal domain-containing protein [Bacilli bacterium]